MGRRSVPIALLLVTGSLLSLAGASRATPRPRALLRLETSTASVKRPLPDVLVELESGAEDIVDLALAGDRPSAVSTARKVRSAANGRAATALRSAGVPAKEVEELRRRATRLARIAQHGRFVEIALAANAVSQLMPGLYARFRNPVPALILALDYFDREAQLRSLADQPGKVTAAVRGLEVAWPRVRPRVLAAGGSKEAAAFDRHVRAMTRLRSDAGTSVQAEAVRGLELVDELERVFTR